VDVFARLCEFTLRVTVSEPAGNPSIPKDLQRQAPGFLRILTNSPVVRCHGESGRRVTCGVWHGQGDLFWLEKDDVRHAKERHPSRKAEDPKPDNDPANFIVVALNRYDCFFKFLIAID
jgi:hypothetical protein